MKKKNWRQRLRMVFHHRFHKKCHPHHHGRAVRIKLISNQKEINNMATTINVLQKVPVTAQPVDAGGHPAAVDGTLTWSFPDESVCKLEVAADGLSAFVVAVAPGTATLTVSGVSQGASIGATAEFVVVTAPAVAINLTIGTPVLQ